MTHKEILNKLYSDYYGTAGESIKGGVISSHWEKYATLTNVFINKGIYSLSGVGFGNFVSSNSLRALKHFLPNRRAQSLLNKFHVDGKIQSAGFNVAKKSKREVDFDCVKQMLSVDLMNKHEVLNKAKTIVVIGDGYGYMTALLRTIVPEAKIICINLGRVLFFDVYYVGKNFPNEKYALNSIGHKDQRLVFWEAENYQSLGALPIDLFINIASMQEMNMDVIRNYFKIMRASAGDGYFYCCNRVEKALPDGAIIRFDAYPWEKKDKVMLDELCPWYQKFPILYPPFWKNFDGPLQHRLVKLLRHFG